MLIGLALVLPAIVLMVVLITLAASRRSGVPIRSREFWL